MQFLVEQAGDARILRVTVAKLTYPVLAAFLREARGVMEDGARELVIDLRAVTYIDSATIGCLMEIHRLLENLGGRLTLSGLHRRVETMLSMTGVLKFLNVEDRASSSFEGRLPQVMLEATGSGTSTPAAEFSTRWAYC